MEIVSGGLASQEYIINSTEVENSSNVINPTLRIVVDGVEWSMVSSFYNSDSTSTHYRVINENDGKVTILFGDGVNGKSPESGKTIVIQYIKSEGVGGNVVHPAKITTVNSTIYDEDGVVTTVAVTNTGSFLGGDDEESIEEIRDEAPLVFKTGDRAVTKDDFKSILMNYPGVADTNVWGENEEAEAAGVPADYEMLNKVKMCLVLQEWEIPDATFKAMISADVYNKSMITVKYEFVEPVFLSVIPTMNVKVTTGHSMSQAQTNIEDIMVEQFSLGETTKLGTVVKYSNIMAAIDNLVDVAYVNMVLEIKKILSDTYDSLYDWGASLDAVEIKPESVRLFIDGDYITTDSDNGDGTGTFSDDGGYTITGTIDYTTGILTVDISGSPTEVYVRYQQDDGNEGAGNILPSFQQICKLDDVGIESITME
jgi:hypothetical protein